MHLLLAGRAGAEQFSVVEVPLAIAKFCAYAYLPDGAEAAAISNSYVSTTRAHMRAHTHTTKLVFVRRSSAIGRSSVVVVVMVVVVLRRSRDYRVESDVTRSSLSASLIVRFAAFLVFVVAACALQICPLRAWACIGRKLPQMDRAGIRSTRRYV